MKTLNLKNSIAASLAYISSEIKILNKSSHFDINKDCETLSKNILNIIYNCNFENMNINQKNYPAIDLGDLKNGIAIQVTSEGTSDKIKNTIETFVSKNMYEKYKNLKFFFLCEGKKLRKWDYSEHTNGKFYFDIEKDIIFLENILEKANDLDLEKLEKLDKLLKDEVGALDKSIKTRKLRISSYPDKDNIDLDISKYCDEGILQKNNKDEIKNIFREFSHDLENKGGSYSLELNLRYGLSFALGSQFHISKNKSEIQIEKKYEEIPDKVNLKNMEIKKIENTDIAIVLSITHNIESAVKQYLEKNELQYGFHHFYIENIGSTSIKNQKSCLEIAEEIERFIKKNKDRKIHIFMATPIEIAFYLGQMSDFTHIVIYEFDNSNNNYIKSYEKTRDEIYK